MSDDLTDKERKLHALTLAEAQLHHAHQAALIERDRYVMELLDSGDYYPTRLGFVMKRHRTHVERIKREWLGRLERWENRKRAVLVAQIVALGGPDPTKPQQ